MSTSPKYTVVHRVSPAVSRRLKEEARRRKAEQAARRAAEAERKRQERLRRGQAAFKGRLDDLRHEVVAFEQVPAGRHVVDRLRQLESRLTNADNTMPVNESDLARAEKELHRLGRELKQTIVQGRAAQDARDLDEESALVLRWKYQAADDRQGSRQFDPDGLARFEAALCNVEDQLARRDLAGARRAMIAVGKQFEEHRALVENRRLLWLTRKQSAGATLVQLQERVDDMLSNPDVQRWQAAASADIARRAEQLTALLDRNQFESATKEAEKLSGEIERAVKAADERQCRQERQDYFSQSTVAALQACGFLVEGITQAQKGDSTDTVIQVYRMDGRVLSVSVPEEGPIQWSVNGFPMHVVTGSDGQPAAACDEAVEQIESIQKTLDEEFGIETSALTWAGQDPNRPGKAAKARPRSASRTARQTREARTK